MRKFLISMFLISNISHAMSLSDNSFSGVNIEMPVAEVIHILKDYESNKIEYQLEFETEDIDCYYLIPLKNDDLPQFMIEADVVVRIEVRSNLVLTQRGVTVGSSKNDILSAYKNPKISAHPYDFERGEYIEVSLSNGNGIIFETLDDIVTSFRLGTDPAIKYIEGCV
ncbi:hypothetical protein [Marinomonas sp. PE14-40]|uniref:hypothetical protein n=1 Tax=Marinomonas sp. PE14-40 TaxID=3060621 RepID=UPI003F66405C